MQPAVEQTRFELAVPPIASSVTQSSNSARPRASLVGTPHLLREWKSCAPCWKSNDADGSQRRRKPGVRGERVRIHLPPAKSLRTIKRRETSPVNPYYALTRVQKSCKINDADGSQRRRKPGVRGERERVRIHLPPAGSPLRTCPARQSARSCCWPGKRLGRTEMTAACEDRTHAAEHKGARDRQGTDHYPCHSPGRRLVRSNPLPTKPYPN
jgi:hypothetical protein